MMLNNNINKKTETRISFSKNNQFTYFSQTLQLLDFTTKNVNILYVTKSANKNNE